MTIACGLDERESEQLAASLGSPVTALPDVPSLLAVLRAGSADVLVILGPGLPDHQVWRTAARARAARPGAVLVALRPAVNRLQRQLGRDAGLDAVLPAGDTGGAARCCRELVDASASGRRGRVVTVFAGKGGCGKTTIAVNLAAALAEDPATRVCLVDLDLRSGDVAVTLGLPPERTIASASPGEPDVVAAVVTPFRPRIDCVLAPVRPGEAERLEAEGVDALLDALAERYDVVVVDTPPAFTGPVLAALDRTRHLVLVTTPERPALQNLRRTLDTLDLLGSRRGSRSIVCNRSDSRVGITAEDVERTLHAPIAGHIPSSRDVPVSVNRCAPLLTTSPGHPVSSAVRELALRRLAAPRTSPFGGAMR
jgi:pilus assembly protein CpaE